MLQYVFSHSFDDTPGLYFLPADNYDLRPEWGRSDYDRRHRMNLAAMYALPWGFSVGAIVKAYSGPPFNITTGSDDNNDTVFNDRSPGVTRNTGHGPASCQRYVHLQQPQCPDGEIGVNYLWNWGIIATESTFDFGGS